MSSNDRSDAFDLERDLPTTAADSAAQREAKAAVRLDFEEYLRFLARFPPPTVEELRIRRGPRGAQPFTLD